MVPPLMVPPLMVKAPLAITVISIGLYVGSISASLAAGKVTPRSAATFNVLMIGNSHVFVNDVPSRVRRHLRSVKGRTTVRAITRGGARLLSFTHRSDVAAAIASKTWDAIVLQEATATFLTPQGRSNFQRAINWFSKRIPSRTRIVLYQTWPWRAGSRYFSGRSSNAGALWRAMQAAYSKASKRARITVAPVGRCWMNAPGRNTFYSDDGNHASVAGSNLAARLIARTITQSGSARC